MARFILFLCALLAFALPAAPARADDISVAGRSMVRVVVISFGEEGEVTGFGRLAAIIVSSENQAEANEVARAIRRAAPAHENMLA